MNTIEDFKLTLREELLMLPGSKPHLNKHIMIRCPFCGDSVKHLDHGHLGVLIDMDDDEAAIVYKCLRCDDSGLFTSKVLVELGIDDLELRADLDKYNSQSKKNSFGNILSKLYVRHEYKIPDKIIDLESAIPKIEYLNNRLGIQGDYALYSKLNIVMSVPEFIIYNKIEKAYRPKDQLKVLHRDYVGFLTTRRELIVNRDITNKNELRYDIYKLVSGDVNKFTKIYMLPFHYNVMDMVPTDIHICEGTFDALGVFFNVNNMRMENNIYMAVCGSGFRAGIKYLIDRGIFGNNITLHIYSDRDKEPWFYKKLFKQVKKYVGGIYLYYNELSKDCGVPKDRIKLTKTKVL